MKRFLKGNCAGYAAVIIVLLFALLINLGAASAAQFPEMTLRLSTGTPTGHPSTQFLKRIATEIAQRTDGKIKIQVYADNSLFSHRQAPDAVMTGTVDMALTIVGTWSSVNPIYEIGTFPFIVDSESVIYENYDTLKEIYAKYDAKNGCKLMSIFPYDSVGMISRKQIQSPSDMAGLKIRVPGKADFDSIEAFGGIPQAIPVGEVYDALAKGAVDGAQIGTSACNTRKWYEVGKYWLTPLGFPVQNLLMNMGKWNSLSKETQKVFLEGVKAAEEWRKDKFKEYTNQMLSEMVDKGLVVSTIKDQDKAAWRSKIKPLVEECIERCDKKKSGEDARKIYSLIQKSR